MTLEQVELCREGRISLPNLSAIEDSILEIQQELTDILNSENSSQ